MLGNQNLVIPAQAGIQPFAALESKLDPGLRRDDGVSRDGMFERERDHVKEAARAGPVA